MQVMCQKCITVWLARGVPEPSVSPGGCFCQNSWQVRPNLSPEAFTLTPVTMSIPAERAEQ